MSIQSMTLRTALQKAGPLTISFAFGSLIHHELTPFAGIWWLDLGNPNRAISTPEQRRGALNIPLIQCARERYSEHRSVFYETFGLNVAMDRCHPAWLARLPEHALVIIPRATWHTWFAQTGYEEGRLVCLNDKPFYPRAVVPVERDDYHFVQGEFDSEQRAADPCLHPAHEYRARAARLMPSTRLRKLAAQAKQKAP